MSEQRRTLFILLALFLLLAVCATQGSAKRARKGGKSRRVGRPANGSDSRGGLTRQDGTGEVGEADVDIATAADESGSPAGSNRAPARPKKGSKAVRKGGKRRRGKKGARKSKRKNNKLIRDTLRQLFGFNHMVAPRPSRKKSGGRGQQAGGELFGEDDSASPEPPEFMLELYRTFTEDTSLMQLHFGTQGNTVRSFFSVAGNIPNRPRGMGKPMTIASVDPMLTSPATTSRQMRVYAFNVTTIPASETVVSSELRLDGLKSPLGVASQGNRSQWVVHVGAYRVEPVRRDGRDMKMVYRREGELATIRQTTRSLWQDAELTRAVRASRAQGHVLVAKFNEEGDATLNRIARDAPSPETLEAAASALPDAFVVTDTERAKRNSGDYRNRPTPMARPGGVDMPSSGTPVLVVYCNDSRSAASGAPEHDTGESLLNSTRRMAKRRARRSSRRLDNPARARNDLPDDEAPPGEGQNPLMMQTEAPGSEIMSTLKPAKQRRGKGRGGRKRKKCRKGRKKKGKRKGCKDRSREDINDSSMTCGRKAMLVDFEDIGWSSWILAPHSFQSFYCAGTCSLANSELTNPTNHAIVQMNLMASNPEIPAPCCVPDKLQPISVLYMDENEMVVLKTYNDMVVTSCRCR